MFRDWNPRMSKNIDKVYIKINLSWVQTFINFAKIELKNSPIVFRDFGPKKYLLFREFMLNNIT